MITGVYITGKPITGQLNEKMLNKLSNSKLANDLKLTQSNKVCLAGARAEWFCNLET